MTQCFAIADGPLINGLQCTWGDGHDGPHSWDRVRHKAQNFDIDALKDAVAPPAKMHQIVDDIPQPESEKKPLPSPGKPMVVVSELAYEIIINTLCPGCRYGIPDTGCDMDSMASFVHHLDEVDISFKCLAAPLRKGVLLVK